MSNIVANLVNNTNTTSLLNSNGLVANLVAWEDTARSKDSCWGPNISDMTLTVGQTRMPIIRKPNHADVTSDTPIEAFSLFDGERVVSLKEYLQKIPNKSSFLNLLHDRDSVILTSSQCCVLPVHSDANTEFAVQLYNYQSSLDNPAVMTVLVSRDGVSTQVVTKSNEKLYFNDHGKSRSFYVNRLEKARTLAGHSKARVDSFQEMSQEEQMDNTLMVFQIPLKQKPRMSTRGGSVPYSYGIMLDGFKQPANECCRSSAPRQTKGMDMGQLGLGSTNGVFPALDGTFYERDDRFPIRCTIQYYRVTDQDYITEKDVLDIASQLSKPFKGRVSGSLVCGTSDRKTEPIIVEPKPVRSNPVFTFVKCFD